MITKRELSQKHKGSGKIKEEEETAFKKVLDLLAALDPVDRENHRLWKYLNRKKIEAVTVWPKEF